MQIGLALSGGGFRATLYHLGVVRFLRDAGLLESVTHVTSVSGGSVLAAHLVLNWDRYNESTEAFDEAAREILDFVRLDVRNRIIRRYPFTLAGSFMRRVAQQRPSRSLSRTGLLERHYRDHLFGDTCLYELPKAPELHILSTNLSEGGLSSFTREGLLYEKRSKSGTVEIKRHRAGLATLSMAVAASSAFPGFFPPLELTAEDIGATEGEFQTQFFTDGGVYDNLGVRMFRYLERKQKSALLRTDFSDVESAVRAWNLATASSAKSALRRITEIHASAANEESLHQTHAPKVNEPQDLLDSLEQIIAESDLSEDAQLRTLVGLDRHEAEGNGNGHGQPPFPLPSDRMSSNREILQMAFRDAVGEPCLGGADRCFEAIIASDAGKKFEVTRPDRAGTFLRTAMRSSDILMDRVWQLEKERLADSADCIFVPITRIVTHDEDATAPHPEIQVQVSRMRTDMDRFADNEASGLVRHGYCVARQAVATRSSLASFTHDGEPWNMINTPPDEPRASRKTWRGSPASWATREARSLQKSSRRQYFGSVMSPRDWVSYVYLPLIALILIGIPLQISRMWRRAHITSMLTGAIAETRQDYDKLLTLLESGPIAPWEGMEFVDANHLNPLFAEQGLDITADTRITDLRSLDPAAGEAGLGPDKHVYAYRLVSVRKVRHGGGATGLRLQSLWDMPNLRLRCHNPELKPQLLRYTVDTSADGKPRYAWQLKLDFSQVPVGHTTNVVVEALLPSDPSRFVDSGRAWWEFEVDADPEVATSWVLLPERWRRGDLRLVRYENSKPEETEHIEPTHQAAILGDSILNWIVVHPKAGYTYTYRRGNDL